MSENGLLLNALTRVFQWNKSRVECFAMIIMGMISAESVNLANIAEHSKQAKKTKYDSPLCLIVAGTEGMVCFTKSMMGSIWGANVQTAIKSHGILFKYPAMILMSLSQF